MACYHTISLGLHQTLFVFLTPDKVQKKHLRTLAYIDGLDFCLSSKSLIPLHLAWVPSHNSLVVFLSRTPGGWGVRFSTRCRSQSHYTSFSVLLDRAQFSCRNWCSLCRKVSVTATSFFNAGWNRKTTHSIPLKKKTLYSLYHTRTQKYASLLKLSFFL